MSQQSNQSGFAVVEAILVVVILAIVGFTGWFVWHSKQAADKTLSDATKTAQSSTPKTTTKAVTTFAECKAAKGSIMQETFPETCVTKLGKRFTDSTETVTSPTSYLTITEWGVKFPYSGNDTLTYKFVATAGNESFVRVISAQLVESAPGCDAYGGGSIGRGTASDEYYDTTVGAEVQQSPANFTKSGNYYYWFAHNQAACANNPTQQTAEAEISAVNFIKALVPKVVAE